MAMTDPTSWDSLIGGGLLEAEHRPWPRAVVDEAIWAVLIDRLAAGEITLLGLWGEPAAVHLAVSIPVGGRLMFGIATLPCPDGGFPSVGRQHPPARRLERTITDLVGLAPRDTPDDRPWLDHGRWPVTHPLGAALPSATTDRPATDYPFLPVEGHSLHQIPVGPVHAGIIEPGHFRFTANGETVVRLEQRLGYVHKGVERLLAGAPLERGARLAGRISGDSTVAYAIAYARAVEAALGAELPARPHWLRAIMAELERIANHLGDVGAVINDAAFSLLQARCQLLREATLRTADACFGHRLMMDRVVPGGVTGDLTLDGATALRQLTASIRPEFARVVEVFEETPSLQDRTVETGILRPDYAARFGAGGFVGRASGRPFDARRTPGYPPYDLLNFAVPVLSEGDVNARVMVRILEIEQSLKLLDQLVDGLPYGLCRIELPPPPVGRSAEGVALVEGFRGDILVWLRIAENGRLDRCHARDPSWFQWPLLEVVIDNNIVADFPLCNKSFNCSYSGHDL